MQNLAGDPAQAAVITGPKALVKQNWPVRVTGGRAGGAPEKTARKSRSR